MFPISGIRAVRFGAEHVPALQELLERCHAFHELVHGVPPGPGEAEHLLHMLPEGKTADDKLVIGLFEDRVTAPSGVLDLIRDCPERGEWFIGLLLFDPSRRGARIGARVHAALEQWVRSQGATGLRLVVQKQNPGALRFWRRQGYEVIATVPQHTGGQLVDLLRKPLTA
jgi:ribosomal protein S18 acetylase RimI-like enzyme